MYILVIIMLLIVVLALITFLSIIGIELCKDNVSIGLLPLFISLNFIGLIIGYKILHKNKIKKVK